VLARIASSRRVSILQAFEAGNGTLRWVAKESDEKIDREQLRCEYEALRHLHPWAEQFGIPQLIEWEDVPARSCLIRTAKTARMDVAALPLSVSREVLNHYYRKPVDWLLRFVRSVPPLETRTLGEMCAILRGQLEEHRNRPGIGPLMELLNSDPAGVLNQNGIVLHGDFFPRNVLLDGDKLFVIDWDHFSTGFPLVDLMNYFSGADIYNPLSKHACPIDQIVLAFSFGNLPMHAYFMECVQAYGYPAEAVRYFYYCAVAHQIAYGSRVEAHRWIRVAEVLAPLGFPAPGTYLPKIAEAWKNET